VIVDDEEVSASGRGIPWACHGTNEVPHIGCDAALVLLMKVTRAGSLSGCVERDYPRGVAVIPLTASAPMGIALVVNEMSLLGWELRGHGASLEVVVEANPWAPHDGS